MRHAAGDGPFDPDWQELGGLTRPSDVPSQPPVPRSQSRQSVRADSCKLTLSEPELPVADWALLGVHSVQERMPGEPLTNEPLALAA